jgi:hypothetical protein
MEISVPTPDVIPTFYGGQGHWHTGLLLIPVVSVVLQVTIWAMVGSTFNDINSAFFPHKTDLTTILTSERGKAFTPERRLLENSESSQTKTLLWM